MARRGAPGPLSGVPSGACARRDAKPDTRPGPKADTRPGTRRQGDRPTGRDTR